MCSDVEASLHLWQEHNFSVSTILFITHLRNFNSSAFIVFLKKTENCGFLTVLSNKIQINELSFRQCIKSPTLKTSITTGHGFSLFYINVSGPFPKNITVHFYIILGLYNKLKKWETTPIPPTQNLPHCLPFIGEKFSSEILKTK